ncbi:MAG: hypothetical protein KDC34_19600, partial [Saprospiraceae bacterium]|nr:hypothetical protein [Saprospiraceae bacterium]
DVSAANGTNVCVPVTVQNFTDIVSMQYSINYNSSILSYTGSGNYGLPGMVASNVGNPSPGNVTVSWLANDVVAGQSVADGTTIFQICFDVIGSGGAVSPLDFSGSPTSIEVTDTGGLVSPVFEDGSVTATGGGGSGTTDLTFTLPDV